MDYQLRLMLCIARVVCRKPIGVRAEELQTVESFCWFDGPALEMLQWFEVVVETEASFSHLQLG